MLGAASGARAEYGGRQASIEVPRLGIDLGYRYDSETRSGPYGTIANTSRVLSEGFELETGGWLYHPALATYTLWLAPLWEQSVDEPSEGVGQRSRSFFFGYDVGVTLLPYKPYTLDLFARQGRSVLTSSLASDSTSVNTSLGATLNLKYPVLPTLISLSHGTTDQSGFYDAYEVRDELRLDSRHERKGNRTNFNAYALSLERTALGGSVRSRNAYGGLRNWLAWGEGNRVQLNSGFYARWSRTDQAGLTAESQSLSLNESLNWQHTKRLRSNYSLTLAHDDYAGLAVDRASFNAGLTHLLYENLTTTATVRAAADSLKTNSYGAGLSFAYQRAIPGGTIYAGLGTDALVTKRWGEDALQPVGDEQQRLSDAALTLLNNRNVVLSSVVVTSSDGSVVYAEGVDYVLEVVGMRVRINRSPFGAIADGQSVLVDYVWQANAAYDDLTRSHSFSLGFYLWSAWRITYRYGDSQQEFLGGTPPDLLLSSTIHAVETDLSWGWSQTRALWEDTQNNTGVSTRRWRVEEALRFQPTPTTFLSASVYLGQTTLKDVGTTDDFRGARAEVQWMVSAASKLRFEAAYAAVQGGALDTVDKGLLAAWEWNYGLWRADASYRYLNQDDRRSGQSRERHVVYFTARRSLN
ncbi:MAG: hypothetical protein Q8M01_08015 [Rubrivivax sp.]|nr:hypothetical protein [Rubrivivax sp.]